MSASWVVVATIVGEPPPADEEPQAARAINRSASGANRIIAAEAY
jgi:hypothetical protein